MSGATEVVAAEAAPKQRKRLAVARFPGEGVEAVGCVDWLMQTVHDFRDDPGYELLPPFSIRDTPVTMSRNRAVVFAREMRADLLLFLDSDMVPDLDVGKDPGAKPFLRTSLDFMAKVDGPSVVAAPYCGPPPHESVYVFDWKWEGDARRPDFRGCLEMVPRNFAAHLTGIQQAAALATGVQLMTMDVFDRLPAPWFYYEAKDREWTRKASTEDVTFSRDCTLLRVPTFCNWDAWAGHVKQVVVGKPLKATVDIVHSKIRGIIAAGFERGDSVAGVGALAPHEPLWPDLFPAATPADVVRWKAGAEPHPLPVEAGSTPRLPVFTV